MKKSYHSKIVPALDAAITKRISFALGSCAATAVALMAAAWLPFPVRTEPLAAHGFLGKRSQRGIPRQRDCAVPARIGPRRFECSKAGPIGKRTIFTQPG